MKILLVISLAVVVTSVGCKKDYTCQCIISDSSLMVGGTTMTNIDNKTKGQAASECDKGDASITTDTLKLITECELL